MRRLGRWGRRALAALLVYALAEVALSALDFAPHALRLALLVGLAVAALGLARDALSDSGPGWAAQPVPPLVPPGSDARLGAYVRLIEDNLTARTPGTGLRDRLVALSGGRLADELAGPPRRLSRSEIDAYLRRIEEQ